MSRYRIISNGKVSILQKKWLCFWISGGSVLSGSLYFCVFGDTFFRVDRYRIKEFAIDSLNSYFENIKKDKIKQIEKKRVENLEWGVVYEINRGDKS